MFFFDKWNIGYIFQSPQNLILNQQLRGEIKWLEEDDADYAADPFAININGRTHLYYEELKFWKGKGEIMMIDSMRFKNKKKVSGITERSMHLSYPHMFAADDNLYCIPETGAAKEIALYQVDIENPYKFKKIKVIVAGHKFVDSSIIYFNNKYWLFTSISGKQGELYIFYSDTLEGQFQAHSLNPISVAPNVNRSAGSLFIVGGKLYMPSQNSEKRYGGSIMINEITTITETNFQYNTAFELLPQFPYDQGLHTINFVGDLLMVVGRRKAFSVLGPFKKLIGKMWNLNKLK
jgi:hypothetical protein